MLHVGPVSQTCAIIVSNIQGDKVVRHQGTSSQHHKHVPTTRALGY